MVIAANRTGVGTSTTRVASSRPPDRPFLAVGVRIEGSSTRPKCENPEDGAAQQRHGSDVPTPPSARARNSSYYPGSKEGHIATRSASEGSDAFPSLARRVNMQQHAELPCRGNKRRSPPCPPGRADRCSPPAADRCPARSPQASLQRRTQLPSILDRTEPQPLLQARHRAAVLRRLQVAGLDLPLNVLDPLLGVEDSRCECPAIHSPPGQQLEQLTRTQGAAAGGVQVQ